MRNYPYTVENGSGEVLTFLGVALDQDGDRLEAASRARPGAGPPMHVHYLQEEAMTVVSGTLGFQIVGEPPRYAGPGETVIFAPGVGHRWWNAGSSAPRFNDVAESEDHSGCGQAKEFSSRRARGAVHQ